MHFQKFLVIHVNRMSKMIKNGKTLTTILELSSQEVELSDIEKEMQELLPTVFNNLAGSGFDETMLQFFRQIKDKTFPLSNIAFLLWTEVVKWFTCNSTTQMRYSDSTKKFWKLGYRMFGGQFVYFMSGYKSSEQVVTGTSEKGQYLPTNSNINFAVPAMEILRKFNPYENGSSDNICRKPGIFVDIIESLAKSVSGKSCCLTFDGKKLKQGLTKSEGDVDLLGFEKECTLSERMMAHENLNRPVTKMLETLSDLKQTKNITCMDEGDLSHSKTLLTTTLKNISTQILSVQDMRKKKSYAKEKLIQLSGDTNWKNGKYVRAISSMIAFIHDIDVFLEASYSMVDEILKCICYIQGTKLTDGAELNLDQSDKFVAIQETENNKEGTRTIKQRSEYWFDARKDAKVTGSTIYKAIGLDGLQKQKQHFDRVVCGLQEKENSEKSKEAMQYGTDNEPNAMATLVGRVLPLLYPDKKVYEEGYIERGNIDGKAFMIVSPDGSVRSSDDENSTTAGIELKCPVFDIQKVFPPRYLLQCLSELESLEVEELIYVCWRPDISTVFKVRRNTCLFERAYRLAEKLYGHKSPKRVTKVSEETRQLQADIVRESKSGNTVEFVTIVSSLKHNPKGNTVYVDDLFRISRMHLMFDTVIDLYAKYYELNRQPATEAVVFLCCDLDREWKDSNIRTAPISWFPKGYSLDTETMRHILENILDICKAYGIHVPAISFDGQFHNICVRNESGGPLTLYQLQKDVWRTVESLSKAAILNEFKTMNKISRWHVDVKPKVAENEQADTIDKKVIVATFENSYLPKFSPRIINQRLIEQHKKTVTQKDTENHRVQNCGSCDQNTMITNDIHSTETDIQSLVACAYDVDNIGYIITNSTDGMDMSQGTDNDSKYADIENINQVNTECRREQIAGENGVLKLNENEAAMILVMLQTDAKCNTKGQWNKAHSSEILKYLETSSELKKLRDMDLRMIVRYLNNVKLKEKIKESASKKEKLLKLYQVFGLRDTETANMAKKNKSKVYQVKSLADLAFSQISSKLKKSELNIIYAEYLWPQELRLWNEKHPFKGEFKAFEDVPNVNRRFPVTEIDENQDLHSKDEENESDKMTSSSEDTSFFWFYSPSLSTSRNQTEVHVCCIDSTHLLTRTRRKCCRGGLDGITKQAWRKVAKSGKTYLSLPMIDGITEPMSASVAVTHFTEEVEKEMRNNGDSRAAELCRDIRKWWQAEDNPGIQAKHRIDLRMALRHRLLSYVDFSHFPPPTMYVKGWPTQLWEALIANIDSKLLLYNICRGNTYNVRAFSSMMGETFFSELTRYDRRGQGTVTTAEFGQFINTSIETLQMRLDPNRTFCYRTSKKTVYPLVDKAISTIGQRSDNNNDHGQDDDLDSEHFPFVDHNFDKPERMRVKGKKKETVIKIERNAIKRGSLGVRFEGARRNESKILPTTRMGIEL